MAKANSSSGLGGPGLLLAVLGGLGVWRALEPIDPGSIETPEVAPLALEGPERIAARLWADPVHAVQHTLSRKGITHASAGVIDLTTDEWEDGEDPAALDLDLGSDSLVLTVFTHRGSHPEIEEKRRRTRYAIQAAFSTSRYAPVAPEFLGAFRFVQSKHLECAGSGKKANGHANRHLFPFEQLELRAAQADSDSWSGMAKKVLVIWVPEDELGEDALRVTHELLVKLCLGAKAGPRFAFIGPTSTGELRKFVKSDAEFGHAADRCLGCPFHEAVLISSWATATSTSIDALSELEAGDSFIEDKKLISRFAESGLRLRNSGLLIERGIGTDKKLVELLVDELELRGIKVLGDRIALLGEFGSAYSDAFLDAFHDSAGVKVDTETDVRASAEASAEEEAKAAKGALAEVLAKTDTENAETREAEGVAKAAEKALAKARAKASEKIELNVELFAYPLGLDGAVPGEPDHSAAQDPSGEALQELAVGPSQVDYVRRLQRELGESDYRAIGIVGSLASDKLMLLRALRGQFPHAVLFTIDIDARYLQQSEYRHARNLLVASHFPLQPEHVSQGGRAIRPLPFRDGYQTANFYAVEDHLRAVPGLDVSYLQADAEPKTLPAPFYRRALGAAGALMPLEAAYSGEVEVAVGDEGPPEAAGVGPLSRERLYEVGRTEFVGLSLKNDVAGSPSLFHLAFPILGVLGIYTLIRMGRVSQSLRETGRSRFKQVMLIALWLLLGAVFVAIVERTASSVDRFWHLSEWSRTRKYSGLGVTAALLVVVWRTLAWGSDGTRRRSVVARIVAVSIPAAGLILLLAGALVAHVQGQDSGGLGEPSALLEGVNVWPTIAVRLVVIVCSIAAFVHLERFLRRGDREVIRSFGAMKPLGGDGGQNADDVQSRSFFRIPLRRDPSRSLRKARQWYETHSRQRAWRSSIFTLLFAVVLCFTYGVDRSEFAHARGDLAIQFEFLTGGLSLLGIAWLIFLVADSTQLCRQLILPFCDRRPPMYWHDEQLSPIAGVMPALEPPREPASEGGGRTRKYPANLHPLMIMRYIAMVTARVSHLSWYPFVFLLVLILAQNSYIENWAGSRSSIALFGVCIIGVLGATVMLRRSAERLRSFLLAELREDMLCHKLKNDKDKLDELTQAIEEIESTQEGAFQPLRQHPIVTAVLLPFGGASTIAMLELMNR